MAAIDWTMVVAMAPELSKVAAAAQTIILDYVNATLQVDAFDGEDGPRTKIARCLLAAHVATAAPKSGGNPGMVSQKMVGPQQMMVSYAAVSKAASALDATSYGTEYGRMLRLALFRKGPILVGGG